MTAARRVVPWVALLIGVAILMRVNNALRYPSVHGYDGYAHVTYVWHLLRAGDLPLPSDGWGRFHPPLYYALCAGIWWLLGDLPPSRVLKIVTLIFSLIGIGCALASAAIARRYFQEWPLGSWLAPAFVLLVPVSIYTAPMFGNETLTVVLCSTALVLLVRLLEVPRPRRAAALGLVLGLALLTKFTAVVTLATSAAVLALWGLRTRRWRDATVLLAVTAVLAVAVAGWFYARNVYLYGTPFQMSRQYFATHRIESNQATGTRGLRAYLSFDPAILHDPLYQSGSVVDSVWTGAFASTWHDAFGNWFLPNTETTKKLGGIILVLAFVPTLLIVLGLAAGVRRLLVRTWNDVLVVMLVATGAMLGMFVVYTRANPIMSAVKASYMLPAIVPFSFWFALGMQALAVRARRLAGAVGVVLAVLALVIVPVYTYQLFFAVVLGPHYWNAIATVDYFAGFRDKARATFAAVVEQHDLYLAHENLASLAIEDGRLAEARAELRQPMALVAKQVVGGTPEGNAELARLTRADYYNSLAVVYAGLGKPGRALRAAERALRLDPTHPEAHYDVALLTLEQGAPGTAAIAPLQQALALDPGFADAARLLGVAQQRAGDCAAAVRTLSDAAARRWPRRSFPHAVGTGDFHDAAIVRHRHIVDLPDDLRPERALAACAGEKAGSTS